MAPPKRTRSSRDSGTVSAAAVLAICRTSGVTPAFSANATASANAASWAATDGCPGMSAQAKCDHRPVTRTEPRAWASRAASTTPGQSAAVAPPRLSPVSALRCSRARTPARTAAASILATNATEPAVKIDVAADRLGGVAEGHQAQHRRGDPGPAERDRLGQVGDAQPAGPAGQRGPGGRDHAVAVPVGLHRGHHLAAAYQVAQRGDVAGDRAEVDEGLPVHRGHRLPNALGSARTRSEAPIGAWPVPSPDAAASRPARPCR